MPVLTTSTARRVLRATDYAERQRRSGPVEGPKRLRPASAETGLFVGEITGSTLIAPEQWTYQWKEKVGHASNPGEFLDKSPAVTHMDRGEAWNLAEQVTGNFERDAVPVGAIVLMWTVGPQTNRFPVFTSFELTPEDCEAAPEAGAALLAGLVDSIITDIDGAPIVDIDGNIIVDATADGFPTHQGMIDEIFTDIDGSVIVDIDGNIIHGFDVDGEFAAIIDAILTDIDGEPIADIDGNLIIGAV